MIALALGLGVLGFLAFRRARGNCYAGGYGWYGPWSYEGGGGEYHDHDHGPPWRGRGRGRRGGRAGRWMLHRALARIDATPAQERVIVGELDKLHDRAHAARASLRDGRGDLAAAVRGPLIDDAALGAVLGRVDAASAELRAAALDALRTIHGVLDEKQREQVADMIEHGPGRGYRGRGGGGGRGMRMGPYR